MIVYKEDMYRLNFLFLVSGYKLVCPVTSTELFVVLEEIY